MTLISRLSIAVAAVLCAASVASAQTTIRLASPAPLGSVWHKALKQFEADVRTATGGRVVVRVIGAAQDDEATMISEHAHRPAARRVDHRRRPGLGRRRLQRLHHPDVLRDLRGVPGGARQDGAGRSSRSSRPRAWCSSTGATPAGSTCSAKNPTPNVDELKKQRLYTSAGDDQFVQLYKANGFNPRPLPFSEVQSGLMTGLLDAVPSTPLATLAFQWYRNVPHMLDLGVGPLAGATVVDAKTWGTISEADRTQVLAVAKKIQDGLEKDVPAQDDQAKAEMIKRGLKVTTPDAAAVKGFRDMADKFATSMRGNIVPADAYDQATRERDAFRKTRGSK